jgi:hypothetical protein
MLVALLEVPDLVSRLSQKQAELREVGAKLRLLEAGTRLADMLLLGYFPFDTYCMGHCLQAHNLCIDGGCADTDSLVAMSAIGNDLYFTELFLNGSLALALSISRYLRGTWGENQAHQVIVSLVWEELHRRLRERLAPGEACDPRLERIVKSTGLFARLDVFLGSILLDQVPPRGEIWV